MATNNMWNSTNPASVGPAGSSGAGGTGDAALSPTYSVLCAGTTTINPVQVVTSNGTAGQLLGSNGVGALPTWKSVGSSQGALVLIQTQTAANSAFLEFKTGITTTYNNYWILMHGIRPVVNNVNFNLTWSINGGLSYLNANYTSGGFYFPWNSASSVKFGSVGSSLHPSFNLNPVAANGSTVIGLSNTQYLSSQMWVFDMTVGGIPNYRAPFFMNGDTMGLFVGGWQDGVPGHTISVNALKFFMSSGNMHGTISIYGIRF